MGQLQPASADAIALANAIQDKFLSLCNLHERVRGVPLVPPMDMYAEFKRWRRAFLRFSQGDFRHDAGEWRSMLLIASWTLDKQCELIPTKKREKMWWE